MALEGWRAWCPPRASVRATRRRPESALHEGGDRPEKPPRSTRVWYGLRWLTSRDRRQGQQGCDRHQQAKTRDSFGGLSQACSARHTAST